MSSAAPGIDAKHPPSAIVDPDGPLMLRAPRIEDAVALYDAKIESLAALKQFMAWAHGQHSIEQEYTRMSGAVGAFWRGDDFVFTICDPNDEARVLGCIGLHRRAMNPRAIEVGYWVRSGAAGKGICTRAARMLVVVAVEYMGFERVQCGYDIGNVASARVVERVGFRVEGDLRGYCATGDDAMRADGWAGTGVNRMTALDPTEARAQPWYAETRDRLVVRDWLGRISPRPR